MILNTPIGDLILEADQEALTGVLFSSVQNKLIERAETPILQAAKRQLQEYFLGQRQKFDLPLKFKGTSFQKKVWSELLKIPYGERLTYSDIAKQVGSPQAVRAVGVANSKNPISIIAACHRVIGKNGTLTGYAGGLPKKQFLLDLESKQGLTLG